MDDFRNTARSWHSGAKKNTRIPKTAGFRVFLYIFCIYGLESANSGAPFTAIAPGINHLIPAVDTDNLAMIGAPAAARFPGTEVHILHREVKNLPF